MDIFLAVWRQATYIVQAWFGGDRPSDLEIVFRGTPLQAQIALGRLQSENIPAMLQTESAGVAIGLYSGPLGEARVLVPKAFAFQAERLLSQDARDETWKPATSQSSVNEV